MTPTARQLVTAPAAFAPTPGLAVALLLARAALSQMDVPVRQSFVMAPPEERAAAAEVGAQRARRVCG